MDVLIRNAEGNVSKNDREYAAKKLGRLDRYFHQAHKVELVHREVGQGHRIEITVFADGCTVTGEEHDENLHAAIDKVSDKLETRLRKLKGRIIDSYRRKGGAIPEALAQEEAEEQALAAAAASNHRFRIKERKSFLLKPMTPDEAALQMEMVDHPFFVFGNEDTGLFAVLYRRKDEGYGLIEPEA